MRVNKFSYLFLILLIFGCNKSKTVLEYQKLVEDKSNGLNKKKEIGEYILEIQYKPLSYVVSRELGQKFSSSQFNSRINELGNTEYCDVVFSMQGGGDIASSAIKNQVFYDKQYYLSFGFQNDIWLEIDSINIPCSLYHFERTYDINNKKKVVLAFNVPKENKNSDRVLVINGEKLGFGIVRTIIKKEDIKLVSEIAIESL